MTDSLDLKPAPSATLATISPDLPHVALAHTPARAQVLGGVRRFGAWLFRRYYRVQDHGFENVPDGPVILAANHVGVLDGPLLVAMTRRLTFAMAKNELFSGAVGEFLELVGQIPVDQNHLDTHALKRAITVLREGYAFAIFPEGGRDDGEMEVIKGGVAYIAMVTGAPVVPVAILGSREPGHNIRQLPRRGSTIHIVYGEPVDVPQVAWPRTQAAVAEKTEELRQVMVGHLARAQAECGMQLPGKPASLELTA
ncbi:lysophospholipid acyltransferase family protein [Mariniluteicoccus endophyticus]